jgi:tetratricopeptide (TPR) repeat protein
LVGFFKRLFSADYRAAVAAEAAGDLDLAAERYALAGQREAAVRVHLARADRASGRADEIDALRDALHWAPPSGEWRRRACKRLGQALLARARSEGIGTDRDRERVREAARLLEEAEEYRAAGDAYESIGDHTPAAVAYRRGGLVDNMEEALVRDEQRSDGARAVREAYADYEVALLGGDRDGARDHLRRCVEAAENKGEYRRLLDDLESRLISGGRTVLEVRRGDRITLFGGEELLIGRDPLCDLSLRSAGVSRRHAVIALARAGDALSCELRDAGSRNGTLLGGLPVSGSVPLSGSGSFALGSECEIDYRVRDNVLLLDIRRGLDQGVCLFAAGSGQPIALSERGVPAVVYFRNGRPILRHRPSGLLLNGERLAHGDVQLIRRDYISVEGVEFDVE